MPLSGPRPPGPNPAVHPADPRCARRSGGVRDLPGGRGAGSARDVRRHRRPSRVCCAARYQRGSARPRWCTVRRPLGAHRPGRASIRWRRTPVDRGRTADPRRTVEPSDRSRRRADCGRGGGAIGGQPAGRGPAGTIRPRGGGRRHGAAAAMPARGLLRLGRHRAGRRTRADRGSDRALVGVGGGS